ncbi:hypothetical protein BC826DRAFT_937130 [Russula brevipes]|nr:hypothetical protein BC826DRAFT_937130 [Russula brevipes]
MARDAILRASSRGTVRRLRENRKMTLEWDEFRPLWRLICGVLLEWVHPVHQENPPWLTRDSATLMRHRWHKLSIISLSLTSAYPDNVPQLLDN